MSDVQQQNVQPVHHTRGRAAGDSAAIGRAIIWAAAFLALAAFVVVRLDLFPLSTTVRAGGLEYSIPRAFFMIDHPFHIARASLIQSAWASLDTLRWVASHQGGYPAEFFPFGLPAVAALLSMLTVGGISVEAGWSVTIVALFLLPGLAYYLIGHRDHLSPAVALIALAGQVSIASDWTHGGFTELVEWGLATNVAGATCALLAIPLLVWSMESRSFRPVALSAGVIALCAVSNPRSLMAVVVVATAIVLHAAMQHERRTMLRATLVRLTTVAILSIGLAAPVVFPLVHYRELYFFLSYQEYESASDYLSTTVDVVMWPVLAFTFLGVVLALVRRDHKATHIAGLSLVLYVAVTAIMAAVPAIRELVPQLELPRLMPFQRLLMIYLAAYGVVELVRRIVKLRSTLAIARDAGVAGAVSLTLIVVFTSSLGAFSPSERGLRDVPRTEGENAGEFVAFRSAVAQADELAPEHTAILVLGSRLSWHEQLWAPTVAEDRRFYYNDWLWYWHRLHAGPYDYRAGHYYPNPGDALADEYLDTHGIGAVVITDIVDQRDGANVRATAASSPQLESAGTIGAWQVFAVVDPVPIATLNGEDPDGLIVSPDNETIQVRFEDADPGTILIRQNWFPRWEATLNGEPVPVSRAGNGYMAIETGGGDVSLTVTYTTTIVDSVARVASVGSGIAILLMLLGGLTPIRR